MREQFYEARDKEIKVLEQKIEERFAAEEQVRIMHI